jgi:hypothetical protein
MKLSIKASSNLADRDYIIKSLAGQPVVSEVLVSRLISRPRGRQSMDADYADAPGTGETGRFKSAWNYTNGAFVVNPIAGFEWDMVMRTPVPHILLVKDRSALVARERGEL